MLGYPELLGTPPYNSVPARMTNMREVTQVLKNPRLDIGVEAAIKVLVAADVPCAPCVQRDHLESSEQIAAIGALETYVTRAMGKLTVPTPPVQFEGAPASQAEPSPLLGQHSRSILAELGWNSDAIDEMISSGAVAETPLP
jgi:crotonobetainyl-CoA:carnitine CoA-transferase CaiB-like acyl-CoA transferase